MLDQRKENTRSSHISKLFLLGGLVLLALAVIFLPLGIAEYSYQQKIKSLKDVITVAKNNVVEPSGATEAAPQFIKAPHVWESLCVDTGPCPTVTSSWIVDIKQEDEQKLIEEVFSEVGFQRDRVDSYETETSGVGTKEGKTINVALSPITDQKIPNSGYKDARWRVLTISASE